VRKGQTASLYPILGLAWNLMDLDEPEQGKNALSFARKTAICRKRSEEEELLTVKKSKTGRIGKKRT